MRLLGPLILVIAVVGPSLAHAQVVSEGPDRVAIVVYPSYGYENLAMVTERRTITLPAGPVRVSFRGVADGIVAQTVAVQGLPTAVKEQNFDYQLLSPGSLMANSQGRMITLVRTNPANGQVTQERARVVSSQNGVTLDIDGRIEALRCSALPEKIVFDDLPPGYADKPTLSVDTVSPRARTVTVTLSYLATGVSWQADYVARIAPDGKTLDLTSWITIANRSATSFPRAPVQVLAGRTLRQPGETRPVTPPRRIFQPNCWAINSGRIQLIELANLRAMGSARSMMAYDNAPPPPPPPPPPRPAAPPPPDVQSEDLGDYKLYTLPEPTTLAAYQTKQLVMFERRNVAFDRVYRFDGLALQGALTAQGPRPARIVLELENRKEKGLGLPLPAGIVRLFTPRADGGSHFAGQAPIRDVPQNLPFEVLQGLAVDVQADWRVTDVTRNGLLRVVDVEVVLTNAQSGPVTLQLREPAGAPDFRVVRESDRHTMKDGAPQWLIRLEPNARRTVTYTLTWRG